MAITTGKFKDFFKFGWTDPKSMLGAQVTTTTDPLNYANAARNQAMNAQMKSDLLNDLAYQQKIEGARMKYDQLYNQMQANALGAQQYMPDPNKVPLPALKMTDLEGPAGKATLEELCDLWRARWSNNWVQRKDITDEFYMVCAQRLVSANRVEAHELADGTHVYRLIERT